MLGIPSLYLKKLKMILSISSKKQIILWKKTKTCLKNPPNDLEKLHSDFSEEGKEEMPTGHMGVFSTNLGITHSIYFRKLF